MTTGYQPAVPMTSDCPRDRCPVIGRHGHAEVNPHMRGATPDDTLAALIYPPVTVYVGDLVDLSAIAERHGTTRGTVASWRNRHDDFPKPVATLAIGPVWNWPDVAAWLASRKR